MSTFNKSVPQKVSKAVQDVKAENQKPTIRNFFDEMDSCSIADMSSFLEDTERKRCSLKLKKFSKEDSSRLIEKLNLLLESPEKEIYPQDLRIWTNSLAGLGYQKEDLEDFNIQKATQVFNQKLSDLHPFDISNTLNGFAKLGFGKDELNLDLPNLSRVINKKFINFNVLSSSTTLHALSKMGHCASEISYDLKESTEKLVQKSKSLLHYSDSGIIARFTHSLAKMERFDELFKMKTSLHAALTTEKIDDLSSNSAFSLLQSQMICDKIYGEKLFGEEQIRDISNKYLPKETPISQLQESVTRSLRKDCTTKEVSVYTIEGKSIRDIDLCYEINGKIFFIEVEGPSHNDGEKMNHSTKQRDTINKAAIAEMAAKDPSKEFYYLQLSYQDIDQVKDGCMTDFLDGQLDLATRMTAKTSEIEKSTNWDDETKQENSSIESTQTLMGEAIGLNKDNSSPVELAEMTEELVLKDIVTTDEKMDLPLEEEPVTQTISNAQSKEDANNLKFKTRLFDAATNPKQIKVITNILAQTNLADGIFLKALREENANIVDAFIESGIDVTKTFSGSALTPLDIVLSKKSPNISIVNSLLCAGAQFSDHLSKDKLNSLLKTSLKEGQIETSCALIENGANVAGLLKLAVSSGSVPLIKTVVNNPGFNCTSKESKKVFKNVAKSNNLEMFSTLVKAGFDADNLDFNVLDSLFALSVRNGDLESANYLMEKGVDVDKPIASKSKYVSALSLAIQRGDCDIAKSLIDHGVNVDDPTNADNVNNLVTPLCLTILEEAPAQIAKDLIESKDRSDRKAFVNTSIYGFSMLFLAVDNACNDIARIFMRYGADIFARAEDNDEIVSPFVKAVSAGCSTEVIQDLIDRGADVNEMFKDGPALSRSMGMGTHDTTRLLINTEGIDVNKENRQDASPLLCAITTHCPLDIIDGLIEAGADINETFKERSMLSWSMEYNDNNKDLSSRFFNNPKILFRNQDVAYAIKHDDLRCIDAIMMPQKDKIKSSDSLGFMKEDLPEHERLEKIQKWVNESKMPESSPKSPSLSKRSTTKDSSVRANDSP